MSPFLVKEVKGIHTLEAKSRGFLILSYVAFGKSIFKTPRNTSLNWIYSLEKCCRFERLCIPYGACRVREC